MTTYAVLPKPLIFAHRGAGKQAPENTMAAFELSHGLGVPAVELDTMLTHDKVPVVIHDHTLDRTTDGRGRVDACMWDEIRQLDAGSYFSKEFAGEKVPELKEVLSTFGRNLLINIELKNLHAPFDALVPIVADLVDSLGMLDSLVFSSFNPLNLLRLKQLLPSAQIALLVEPGKIGRLLTLGAFHALSPNYIHPSRDYINPDFLAREHARGRAVNAWTVNDPNEARRFIAWGVDGLITDNPSQMLALIQ